MFFLICCVFFFLFPFTGRGWPGGGGVLLCPIHSETPILGNNLQNVVTMRKLCRWIYHHYCAMVMALVSLTWEIEGQPECAQKQVSFLKCFMAMEYDLL